MTTHDADFDEWDQRERQVGASASFLVDSSTMASTMHATEIIDRIASMRRQEEGHAYRCVDYLAHIERFRNAPDSKQLLVVNAKCRSKMYDWSLQIVNYCKLGRETVSVAMSYLDRFLTTAVTDGNVAASRAAVSRREYQLAAVTALYMAVKIHGGEPLAMNTELVSALSRGAHSAREIADMEMDILTALGWRTSEPTPLEFLHHLLALLPPVTRKEGGREEQELAGALLESGQCQTELAPGEYDLVPIAPSSVAVAALLNSVIAVDEDTMPLAEKTSYLRAVRDAAGVNLFDRDVCLAREKLQEAFSRNTRRTTHLEADRKTERMLDQQRDEVEDEKLAWRSSEIGSPTCVSKR